MHPHNRLMGQLEILAQYSGARIDRVHPPAIAFHLEHSWSVLRRCPDKTLAIPTLAWRRGSLPRSGLQVDSRRIAIGAPWLYLLARRRTSDLAVPWGANLADVEEPTTERDRTRRHGIAWFPQHSIQGALLARELASQLPTSAATTVVLPHAEYLIDRIRGAYEDRGLRVISLPPSIRPPGATGPNSLEALLLCLDEHGAVASNGLHLAHLLGASLGLRPLVAGPAPNDVAQPAHGLGRDLVHERNATARREMALHELGHEHVLPPADLRALLDWSSHGS